MELVIRIVGIIIPVLVVSAIGYFYGRFRKPDMTWINRLCTDLLFPLLIFTAMASKDFHILEYLPAIGISHSIISGTVEPAWILGSRRKALANTVTNTVSRAMLSIHAGFRAISKKRALNYY